MFLSLSLDDVECRSIGPSLGFSLSRPPCASHQPSRAVWSFLFSLLVGDGTFAVVGGAPPAWLSYPTLSRLGVLGVGCLAVTGGHSNAHCGTSYIVPLALRSPVLVAGGAHGLVSP